MAGLPQLTPLGSTFFYNNSAIVLAGHLVATVHGTTYEQAVRELLLDPLHLEHTRLLLVRASHHRPHRRVDLEHP